jgi:IclR family acetate operon transcriptional repressor
MGADDERKPAGETVRRSTVQSVERAFEILNLLREASLPMSALEIAKVTGLDRTVVHRLLRTLALEGMAIEDRGAFRLGPASVLLAHRYLDNLLVRRLALPYLVEIQTGTIGEKSWTVTLSIPVGDVSTVIERIWTRSVPLGMVLDIGDTFPIDRGAAGRSVLAFYPEDEARALIGDERYGAVEPVLARAREAEGVALSRGEARAGIYAVAAAIISRRGVPVASLSVSGLDLGDELGDDSALAGTLRRAAQAIGQTLP